MTALLVALAPALGSIATWLVGVFISDKARKAQILSNIQNWVKAQADDGTKSVDLVTEFKRQLDELRKLIPVTPPVTAPAVPAKAGEAAPAFKYVMSYGDTGSDVSKVEILLETLGFYTGAIDGDFGPMMVKAVKSFQGKYGLEVDGEVGAMTLQKLIAVSTKVPSPVVTPPVTPLPTPTNVLSAEDNLRAELVSLWNMDVGQRETQGSNRSPMIDEINREIGEALGSSYCIAGLLVRGVKALCDKHGFKNPVLMTASTQEFYDEAPAMFKKPKPARGLKADIGVLVDKSDSDHGHAFGLTSNELNGIQSTVEYNTNGGGSSNGDGVYNGSRTQDGTSTKTFRGYVDVIAWILSNNKVDPTVVTPVVVVPSPEHTSDVAVVTCPTTAAQYKAKYDAMKIPQSYEETIGSAAETLAKYKDTHYGPAMTAAGMPVYLWWVAALIHLEEAGMDDVGRFNDYLHNGDPMTNSKGKGLATVDVPKGRGPFRDASGNISWIAAAVDALKYDNIAGHLDWSVGGALQWLEQYNGLGYRYHGVASPYLWAMSDQYEKGYYNGDGNWAPNLVSRNYGCASVLKGLDTLGVVKLT